MTDSQIANTPTASPVSPPGYWVDLAPDRQATAPTRAWLRELHAFASVLFADENGPPPEARLNWAVGQIEDIIGHVRGRGALVYRVSVGVLSWVAPLLIFRLPTLSRLSYAQRVRAVARFERSPFGLMLFAVKALLCIVYYEHPEAAAAVGFDGRGLLEGGHDA